MAKDNTTVNNEAKAAYTENLAAPTRKGVYENLKKDISAANEKMKNATNNDAAIEAVNNLEQILTDSLDRRYIEDVVATVKDIVGTIPSVRTFDRTRIELYEMVLILIGKIDKIRAEEAAKQDVENLRRVFIACAEHAPEIAKIIGIGAAEA